MIEAIRQRLKADGFEVTVSQLCRWFELPRRTMYYKQVKAPAKVDPALAEPIKKLIEEEPSFGYRTVAGLLDSKPPAIPPSTVHRAVSTSSVSPRRYACRERRSRRCEASGCWRLSGAG